MGIFIIFLIQEDYENAHFLSPLFHITAFKSLTFDIDFCESKIQKRLILKMFVTKETKIGQTFPAQRNFCRNGGKKFDVAEGEVTSVKGDKVRNQIN